jgi:hypothetical protein
VEGHARCLPRACGGHLVRLRANAPIRFRNYDDPEWVTQNPHIIGGLSGEGVKWAFTRLHAGPLASVSHMLNYEVFGPNPMSPYEQKPEGPLRAVGSTEPEATPRREDRPKTTA